MSSELHGRYTFDEVKIYQGEFEYLRYSFEDNRTVHCYAMQIAWSDEYECLEIRHKGISDSKYRQFGRISMPKKVPYLFILSNDHGLHNINILGLMDFTRVLHGGLYTVSKIGEQAFAPRLVPVVLRGTTEEAETRYVHSHDEAYPKYALLIEKSREIVASQASQLLAGSPSP